MLVGLFIFGCLYNWWVSWVNRQGYSDGYTALLVVVGVAVTVGATGVLVGWQTVLILFLAFVASGTPMVAGDVYRHVTARRAEFDGESELILEATGEEADGNTTQEVAPQHEAVS